jgi:hypothetical protein
VYVDRVEAGGPEVPRVYVRNSLDREFDSALQDRMAAHLGAAKVVTLESGLLTMPSRPRELAEALNDFVAGLG